MFSDMTVTDFMMKHLFRIKEVGQCKYFTKHLQSNNLFYIHLLREYILN